MNMEPKAERRGPAERGGGRLRHLIFIAKRPLLDVARRVGIGRQPNDIEELRRAHAQIAEQNRHNELRAQAWRLALDRGSSEGQFVQKMLDSIGPALGLDRVTFLRICPETGDAVAEQEWCGEGTKSCRDVRIPAEFCTTYRNRKHIEVPDDVGPAAKEFANRILQKTDTKACLLIPYGEPDDLKGFIAFSDCKAMREWSEAEKGTLEEMARIIASRAEHARLERKLCKVHSMDLIGKLAAGINHDLNNVLAGVSGYAELLKRRHCQGNSEAIRWADGIIQSSKRAADLAERVLAFSRQGKYDVRTINVHSAIDEAAALIHKAMGGRKIRIVEKLEAKQPFINAYGAQVCSALVNLGVRALEGMKDGDTLTYETQAVELGRSFSRHKPYRVPPGTYLRISVIDTGLALDKAAVATLFEPFSGGRGNSVAAGLGMASVYGIVKNHDGFIEARGEAGRGNAVDIYFPLAAPPPVAAPAARKVVRGHGNILVVDDEPQLRKIVREMLTEIGYGVHACEDGKTALEFYSRRGKEIGLVLLDMMMPGMSGSECFAELKKMNPDVRVLIMSGYTQDGDARGLLEAGAVGFLPKPFDLRSMSAEIKKHIGEE